MTDKELLQEYKNQDDRLFVAKVLDKINFMNNDFLFANEVLYDESATTNNYKIMLVDYNNKVLKKVTNAEVLSLLLPKFIERIN